MSEQLLDPAERMALTVARAQVERGEHPMGNVSVVCVMALARLVDTVPDLIAAARAEGAREVRERLDVWLRGSGCGILTPGEIRSLCAALAPTDDGEAGR